MLIYHLVEMYKLEVVTEMHYQKLFQLNNLYLLQKR